MNIIGNVEGRDCLLVDDMVDTAGTLCNAAKCAQGARRDQGRRLLHPRRAVGRALNNVANPSSTNWW
jgi:ribose-phosphate pyrophosphokinase